MFRVGQKVVCIKRRWSNATECVALPVKGVIYTVRGYDGSPDRPDIPAILLEEVVNPKLNYAPWGMWEPSWFAGGFRPVVERKTDISVFLKMLYPETVA